jgi:hypothetical protein
MTSTNLRNDLANAIGSRRYNKVSEVFEADEKAGASLLEVVPSPYENQCLVVTQHSVTCLRMKRFRTRVVFRERLAELTNVEQVQTKTFGRLTHYLKLQAGRATHVFLVGGSSVTDHGAERESEALADESAKLVALIRDSKAVSQGRSQPTRSPGQPRTSVRFWPSAQLATVQYEPELQELIARTDKQMNLVVPVGRAVPRGYLESLRRATPLLNDLKPLVNKTEIGKFLDEDSIVWKRQVALLERYCPDPRAVPPPGRSAGWETTVSAMLWDLSGALAITSPSIYHVYEVVPVPSRAVMQRATAISGFHRMILDCRLANERDQISNLYSNLGFRSVTAMAVTIVRLQIQGHVRTDYRGNEGVSHDR